jgi:hypothetical protein
VAGLISRRCTRAPVSGQNTFAKLVLFLETLPEFGSGGVKEVVVDGVGIGIFDSIENSGLVCKNLTSC